LNATTCQALVALNAADFLSARLIKLRMAQITRIHSGKNSFRMHYIPEWSEFRGLRQTDLVEATGLEKSTISRWFKGAMPKTREHMEAIAVALQLPEPDSFLRHPQDDWMARQLRGKTEEDVERLIDAMRIAFRERPSEEFPWMKKRA
jgi:transcriptional regulator with XRE-family HTH domain